MKEHNLYYLQHIILCMRLKHSMGINHTGTYLLVKLRFGIFCVL